MDYRQMVIKAMDNPNEKTLKVLEMTDEMLCRLSKDRQDEMDDFLVRLSGELEDGHFSLATAEWAIERMEPTLLIHNGERYRGTLLGFMADKGLNASMCRRMVDEAYRKAYDENGVGGLLDGRMRRHGRSSHAHISMAVGPRCGWNQDVGLSDGSIGLVDNTVP